MLASLISSTTPVTSPSSSLTSSSPRNGTIPMAKRFAESLTDPSITTRSPKEISLGISVSAETWKTSPEIVHSVSPIASTVPVNSKSPSELNSPSGRSAVVSPSCTQAVVSNIMINNRNNTFGFLFLLFMSHSPKHSNLSFYSKLDIEIS